MGISLPFGSVTRNSIGGSISDPNFGSITTEAPSLYLPFASSLSLGPLVTFTRASGGTYYDASGVMQTASTNVPRFTHDPVTGQSLGLLIEESRTNLLTYSEEFDNESWVVSNITVSANSAIAPDGTLSMDKIVENTANATHTIQYGTSVSFTSGVAYTESLFAKKAERNFVMLSLPSARFGSTEVFFNLEDGSVATNTGGATAIITNVGNGIYRCSITKAASSTGTGTVYPAAIAIDGSTKSYTGDGTSGIYIWGAQLEAGSFSTSYIKTTSSTVTRAADSAAITGSNFSSFYNQAEGTIVCLYRRTQPSSAASPILSVSDGGTQEYLVFQSRVASPSGEVFGIGDAGTTQAQMVGSSLSLSDVLVVSAGTYRLNDAAYSVLGGAPATDSSLSLPTVDRMYIGGSANNSGKLNGTLASIAYYPTRLSNSYLQYLTS